VVGVDDRRFEIGVGRVGVPRQLGHRGAADVGERVERVRGLGVRQHHALRGHDLDADFFGIGEQHFVLGELCLETVLAEAVENVLGDAEVAGGAGHMRLAG